MSENVQILLEDCVILMVTKTEISQPNKTSRQVNWSFVACVASSIVLRLIVPSRTLSDGKCSFFLQEHFIALKMVLPMPTHLRSNSLTNRLQLPLPPLLNSNAKPTDKKPNFNTPSKKPYLKQSSSPRPNSYELNSHPEHIDSSPLKPLDSKSYSPRLGPDKDALDLEFGKKLAYLELMEVDISRAIRDNPLILSTSFRSLEKIVGFLMQWGMLHKDLGKIFGMCPQLLTCNVDKDLVPILDFLLFEVKIVRKDIRKCINRCPRILTSSVTEQLRPTLQYLKNLGIQEKRFKDCSNTVLLVASIENTLVPKLEYLQSLGFDHEDAVSMVVRAPVIFSFSIANNLKPKFDYLVNEMGLGLDDLLEFPQYFSFSLEKRIKPRHELLVKHNLSLPLPAMLMKNDPDFLYTLRKQLAG